MSIVHTLDRALIGLARWAGRAIGLIIVAILAYVFFFIFSWLGLAAVIFVASIVVARKKAP